MANAAPEDRQALAVAQGLMTPPGHGESVAAQAPQLASALATCGGDLALAADAIGIDLPRARELADAIAANPLWANVAKGEAGAMNTLGHGTIGLLMARLAADVPLMTGEKAASASTNLARALDLMAGQAKQVYSQINLVVDGLQWPQPTPAEDSTAHGEQT